MTPIIYYNLGWIFFSFILFCTGTYELFQEENSIGNPEVKSQLNQKNGLFVGVLMQPGYKQPDTHTEHCGMMNSSLGLWKAWQIETRLEVEPILIRTITRFIDIQHNADRCEGFMMIIS